MINPDEKLKEEDNKVETNETFSKSNIDLEKLQDENSKEIIKKT